MPRLALPGLFLLVALLSLPTASLMGQANEAERSFIGHWEILEPAGDTCFLVIKRQGRATCFWSGETDTFLRGDWEWDSTRKRLIVTWNTGLRETLELVRVDTIVRRSFPAGSSIDGEPSLLARGTKIDDRMVGSLAETGSSDSRNNPPAPPPDAPEGEPPQAPPAAPTPNERGEIPLAGGQFSLPAPAPAMPLSQDAITLTARSGFLGYWRVERRQSGFMGLGIDRDAFYLLLQRTGQVESAWRAWEEEDAGQKGAWEPDGSGALIRWPSGHADRLEPTGSGDYRLTSYEPSRDGGLGSVAFTAPASQVPASDARSLFEAGATSILTTSDWIGLWQPMDPRTAPPHLEIERWGNVFRLDPNITNPTDRVRGQWRMLRDSIVISWPDDSTDVLEITQDGFIQATYTAGTPITGVPDQRYRVRKITREEIAMREAEARAIARAEAEKKRALAAETRLRAEAQARRAAQREALERAAEAERLEREAAEAARLAAEAERRRLAEEETRRLAEAEMARLAAEEADRRREAEETARQRAEAEAEARRLAEMETEAQRRAEEAARMVQRDAERRAAEEAERLKAEQERRLAEQQRRVVEVVETEDSPAVGPPLPPAMSEEDEAERAATQVAAQEKAARQRAEQERLRQAEEEARRLAEAQTQAESQQRRREAEQRAAQLAAQEDARRQAAEEAARQRIEAEAQARLAAEEAARQRAEEERLRRAEEDARRRAFAEQQARQQAERRARPPRFAGLQPVASSAPFMEDLRWDLVLEDRFANGFLNDELWNIGYPNENILNDELSGYSPDMVEVNDGKLRITSHDRPIRYAGRDQPYRSGVVTTFDKFEQTYGYFEIKCKVTAGQGIWPNFWLFSEQGKAIRVFDLFAHEADRVYHTLVTQNPDGTPRQRGSSHKQKDFTWDYHTVGVMWTPSAVIFHLDGVETARFTEDIPDTPMSLVISQVVGGSGPGNPDGWTPFPATFSVEVVRVFRLAE